MPKLEISCVARRILGIKIKVISQSLNSDNMVFDKSLEFEMS